MTEQDSAVARRGSVMPVWLVFTIAGVLGLFYAFVVWNAVTLLVFQAGGRLGLNGLGWFVLLFAIVFPIAAYAGAFALGWRRRAGEFVLILVTGLALVACFWLSILAYAYAFGAGLLGSS
ncbi:bacitracin resistance protein [Microbacterium mangrovi]|uniref:Bacitracin resistance protein n=1 Tax=Microbacterium mangrovi TaxID=1348253 RepID=A0A0B2A6P1_9MICO|nr:hypothetical protein [Microbacterium mangrovi]KHK97423.1 bacitracin resistance protein [Microbacterium mangrovi]